MINEPEKPKTFEQKALSHIPKEILSSMVAETRVDTEGGLSPLEIIMREKGKPLPTNQPPAPQQEQFVSLAVDGHVIKIPADRTQGAVVMFMYLLSEVWSKDKKVAKILKQFNFQMFDANNNRIYPKNKK